MTPSIAIVTGFTVALFFFALLREAIGLSLVTGLLAALAAVCINALSAGRKSATAYKMEDPRLGAVAGTWMGVWVGLGGAIGLWLFSQFMVWFFGVVGLPAVTANNGLVFALALIGFVFSVLGARIAGREAAHPPEPEDEA